jgi:hypothetical protein
MALDKGTQRKYVRAFRDKYLFISETILTDKLEIAEAVLLHQRLFDEEKTEFNLAMQGYKRNKDGTLTKLDTKEQKIEVLDAVCDCLYILHGCELHLGYTKQCYDFISRMQHDFNRIRRDSIMTDQQIEDGFRIVQESNMSKGVELDEGNIYPIWENLNPTNKELYNNFVMDYLRGGKDLDKWRNMEKGKLMKGDAFKAPNLSDLI